MTTHERLINYVFQVGQKFNCGYSILTLLPFVIFVVYFWLFSKTYIITLINPYDRPSPNIFLENQWGKYFFTEILTLVLVWSGVHCWSYGLIRFLNKYTIVFLTMVNDSLKSNYKMDHTTILTLESICKLAVCYSVVYFIRDLYIKCLSNHQYQHHQQMLSRIHRFNNRPTYVYQPEREPSLGELGHNGIMLMYDNDTTLRPENHSLRENANTSQIRHTQSCLLPRKIGSILTVKKRNSL